jgi:hypothetical protein
VYSTAVPSLHARIVAACQTVRTTPGILSDCTNVTKRSDNCNYAFPDPCCHTLFFFSLYEESDPEVLPLSFEIPCIVM